MKKVSLYIVALTMFSCSFYLYAKRAAPAIVPPVILGDFEYRAPYDPHLIGCVQAIHRKTGDELWWRQIYTIRYNLNVETDVQDVWIKKLQPKDGKLLIENERGGTYLLDVNSLEVKCLTGKLVVEW